MPAPPPILLILMAVTLCGAQGEFDAHAESIRSLLIAGNSAFAEGRVEEGRQNLLSAAKMVEETPTEKMTKDVHVIAAHAAPLMQNIGAFQESLSMYTIACSWCLRTGEKDLAENCHHAGWVARYSMNDRHLAVRVWKTGYRCDQSVETLSAIASTLSDLHYTKGAMRMHSLLAAKVPDDPRKVTSAALAMWQVNLFVPSFRLLRRLYEKHVADPVDSSALQYERYGRAESLQMIENVYLSATRACLWDDADFFAMILQNAIFDLTQRTDTVSNARSVILAHLPEMRLPSDLQVSATVAACVPLEMSGDRPGRGLFNEQQWLTSNDSDEEGNVDKKTPPSRMKVAYVYAQGFTDVFPVPRLIQGSLGWHKEKTEIYCLSLDAISWENSASSIQRDCEHFELWTGLSDEQVAARMKALGIQVALDISGHTLLARPGIFAWRAVPIQVNLLAFPGTMGCEGINHIVTDSLTIPPEYAQFYTESVISLPHTPFVNSFREIPKQLQLLQAESELHFDFDCTSEGDELPCGSLKNCQMSTKAYSRAVETELQGYHEEALSLYELAGIICSDGNRQKQLMSMTSEPRCPVDRDGWRVSVPSGNISSVTLPRWEDTREKHTEDRHLHRIPVELVAPISHLLNSAIKLTKNDSLVQQLKDLVFETLAGVDFSLLTQNLSSSTSDMSQPSIFSDAPAVHNATKSDNNIEENSSQTSGQANSEHDEAAMMMIAAMEMQSTASARDNYLGFDVFSHPPAAMALAANSIKMSIGTPRHQEKTFHSAVKLPEDGKLLADALRGQRTVYNSKSVRGIYGLNHEDLKSLRQKHGIPEDVFVFAAFCAPYKFQRSTWETWMRILSRVPNSILWLLDYIGDASKTMQQEALRYVKLGYLGGWNEKRIIFTKLLPRDWEMLAKGQWVDLALDTPHFNGHTTAVETLWAGIPLLTSALSTGMHGRLSSGMIASSTRCIEGDAYCPRGSSHRLLIARNLDDYEEIAVRLACGYHPANTIKAYCWSAASDGVLETARAELRAGRLDGGTFDIQQWTHDLDRGLRMLWDIRQMTNDASADDPNEDKGVGPTYKPFHVRVVSRQ